ncbi:hypothetical protein Tco_0268042 [Tanacetum coccineum]
MILENVNNNIGELVGVVLVREDVEAFKNVIEDETHFIMKVIDEYLHPLTTLTKHLARGREVNGGGVVFGVFNRLFGENPDGDIREVGGDSIGIKGGAD